MKNLFTTTVALATLTLATEITSQAELEGRRKRINEKRRD